jgi:hypothetical protein
MTRDQEDPPPQEDPALERVPDEHAEPVEQSESVATGVPELTANVDIADSALADHHELQIDVSPRAGP